MRKQSDLPISNARPIDPSSLARALEASWDHRTAYKGIVRAGNPAFGQCYPTSRIVQWFYPEYEIAKGDVWTGSGIEHHFWNVRDAGDHADWLDLSWQQFPAGSVVRHYGLLDRNAFGHSEATVKRCTLLLQRVLSHLSRAEVGHAPAECANGRCQRPSAPAGQIDALEPAKKPR